MERQKYDSLLGFAASILGGHLTGGTQVGRALNSIERNLLKTTISELRTKSNHTWLTNISLALDAFEEAIFELLSFGEESFDSPKIGPLFHLMAVSSLAAINELERNFNDINEPVENMLLASKLLCISFYFKEKSIELSLCFKANKQSLEKISNIYDYLNIETNLNSTGAYDFIAMFMKLPAVEEALKIMNCIPKNKISKVPSRGMKGLRKGNLDSFTLTRKSKLKRNKSQTCLLKNNAKLAKKILKEIFTLSILLKSFRLYSPVIYQSRELDVKSVPQIFQTTFTSTISKKSSKKKALSFEVIKNHVIVLYDNGTIEIFDNQQHKSVGVKSVDSSTTSLFLIEYEEFLVVGAGSTLHLFDSTSNTFEEIRSFIFKETDKVITSLTSMAGYLYVGFDDGSIAMWFAEANKVIATYQIENEDDIDIKAYDTNITCLSSDISNHKVISIADHDKIFLWNGIQKNQIQKISNGMDSNHGKITAICAEDGEIFTGGTDGYIRVWDITGNVPNWVLLIKRAHYEFPIFDTSIFQSTRKRDRLIKIGKARRKKRNSTGSTSGSTFPSFTEKEPCRITSLTIQDDILVSTGTDKQIKIWNLSQLTSKCHPAVIKKDSVTEHTKLIDNKFYCIGENLDLYDLEGIPLEKEPKFGKLGKEELSFSYPEDSKRVQGDGLPKVVMNISNSVIDIKTVSLDTLEGVNLETALKSRLFRKEFMKFLKQAYAEESLEFYIVCSRFRRSFNKLPEKTRSRESRKIMKRFVEVGSKKQINICDKERKRLLSTTEASEAMFNKAVQEVYSLMDFNFFLAFKRNSTWNQYIL